MELLVAFDSREEFLGQRAGLRSGCLLVPIPEPPPRPLSEIGVRLRTPTGAVEAMRARVLQILGTSGVVLGIEDPAAVRRLEDRLVEAEGLEGTSGATRVGWAAAPPAPAAPSPPEPLPVEVPAADAAFDPDGGATEPSEAEEEEAAAAEEPAPTEEAALLADRIRRMTATEKMQLAAKGDRPSRLLLMKDPMRTVQTFLLQNPRITLEEVRALAGSRQGLPDALQAIAAHRDWSQNPGIVMALVRNPRTPPGASIRLLDRLPEQELRRLGRSNDVPRAVQLAARKRVSGGG